MATRNAALFCLLAATWGSAFAVTRVGLDFLPPVLFAALRFDLAAAAMLPLAVALGHRVRPRTRGDWAYVVAGGLLTLGLHHALLFAGQRYVASAVASVLLGLVPVVTPALERLAGTDERVAPLDVVGVLVGFAGVVVIAAPDPANLLASARGAGLVFASAVAFAAGAVLTDRTTPDLDPLGAQPAMYLVGAVALHLAALALPGESLDAATFTPTAVGALVYMALVAGVGGFTLYFVLLRRLRPFTMGLLEYVIPPFAVVTGFLLLDEQLTGPTVLGFVLVLAGFVVVKRRAVRARLRRVEASAD